MKITFHGHRPSCFRLPHHAPVPPVESRSTVPQDTATKTVFQFGLFKLKIHRQSARQIELVAQADEQTASAASSATGITRAGYLAEWEAWAALTGGALENRTAALNQLKACLDATPLQTSLDLSRLQLTCLPDHLPAGLQDLNLFNNRLTCLPENLPPTLCTLNAARNHLDALPERLPATLEQLLLQSNKLTYLPLTLPSALQALDVSDNQLTSLPAHFPPSLQALHLAQNQLVSLPDHLPLGLRVLEASNNGLEHLPDSLPSMLERLSISSNRLRSLPEQLPMTLQSISASGNRLTCLPTSLPAALLVLDVSNNLLTGLPSCFPATLLSLNVSGNHLSVLPHSLPDTMRRIDADNNNLTSLPDRLPLMLNRLNVVGNQLTRLPARMPSGLHDLFAAHNQLSQLPDNLPAALRRLVVAHNHLTQLPDHLPSRLQLLQASNNRLASLPRNVQSTLAPRSFIVVDHNPALEWMHGFLQQMNNLAGYQGYNGPRFSFSIPPNSPPVLVRNLEEAVSAWHDNDKTAAREAWRLLSAEAGAAEFAHFLDRLRETVNASNPDFQRYVVTWLAELAVHDALRTDTFRISVGATASCEDRVSMTLNDMSKARLTAAVERGDYDHRLDELVAVARGMFRLDTLEKISCDKVKSLRVVSRHRVDEVEVYLAYQVKLRDALHLPVATPDMRFFAISHVTQDDVTTAEAQIKERENIYFVDYLSTAWSPWQAVLKRLTPTEQAATVEKLIDALDEPFQARLTARLRSEDLEHDADAQRIAGVQIKNDIAHEINRQCTADFLMSKNLSEVLEPRW